MGTRNLTCVFHKQIYKVAQYCQWDGYPSGVGTTVLNFLKEVDIPQFTSKLENVSFITPEDYTSYLRGCGHASDDSFVSYEVWREFEKRHPLLTRDIGPGVLDAVYKSFKQVLLMSDLDFAANSLFCEWCYVIDLDKKVFEIYEGFNKRPLSKKDRFHYLQSSSPEDYYPVRLVKKYDLSSLPTNQEFISDLEPEE